MQVPVRKPEERRPERQQTPVNYQQQGQQSQPQARSAPNTSYNPAGDQQRQSSSGSPSSSNVLVSGYQAQPTSSNSGSSQNPVGNTGLANTGAPSSSLSVQDSLNNLLSKDSTYMQQASQAGLNTAASRGLLNSSIGAGAAQQAAIQSGLSVVQPDVAYQQDLAKMQYQVAANTAGQYMQSYQDIMNNAAISINEIETAIGNQYSNISQAEKDKMIANTIARRDADLAFLKEFYGQMPTWSYNWASQDFMPAPPGLTL